MLLPTTTPGSSSHLWMVRTTLHTSFSNSDGGLDLPQPQREPGLYLNLPVFQHILIRTPTVFWLAPLLICFLTLSNFFLSAGVPGSDYVNANYIDGYRKQNAYIATQGPLPETLSDFWRMVWEQRTCTIIMMTRLEEKSRVSLSCWEIVQMILWWQWPWFTVHLSKKKNNRL